MRDTPHTTRNDESEHTHTRTQAWSWDDEPAVDPMPDTGSNALLATLDSAIQQLLDWRHHAAIACDAEWPSYDRRASHREARRVAQEFLGGLHRWPQAHCRTAALGAGLPASARDLRLVLDQIAAS